MWSSETLIGERVHPPFINRSLSVNFMSEKGVRPQPARKTNYLIFIYVIERDFKKHSTELDESSSALPCLLYPLLNRTHIVSPLNHRSTECDQRQAQQASSDSKDTCRALLSKGSLTSYNWRERECHFTDEEKELEIQKPLLYTIVDSSSMKPFYRWLNGRIRIGRGEELSR